MPIGFVLDHGKPPAVTPEIGTGGEMADQHGGVEDDLRVDELEQTGLISRDLMEKQPLGTYTNIFN